jgi:asparagine synthase (glutamine-hydrolysing)
VNEKGYLKREFYETNVGHSKTADTIYNSASLHEALLDHFEYKLEHLLKWEDRYSMRFSIEARVPFLDHRIVEQTIPLPSDMIISNGTTKYIFREAMKGLLPEVIRMRQDKVGFATPESEWFRKDFFRKFITELLDSESFANRKIIDVEKAKDLYKKHINKEIDIAREIWKWINLELWYRDYID